jgi:hypothetical protein
MRALLNTAETTDLVRRLRRVLLAVDLDCQCRASLEGALNRFTSLEYRRQRRKALADAREHRDEIIARLAFLAELDEVTEGEADATIFEEMAILFDEIGDASASAANAIRSTAFFSRRVRPIE